MATASAATERPASLPVADEPPSHRDRTRARYPDAEGYVERDGVRLWYEVYGARRADDPAGPHLADLHSRFGRRRSRTSRAMDGWSPSTARERPLRPAVDRRGACRPRDGGRHPDRDGRDGHRPRGARHAVGGHGARAPRRGRASGPGRRPGRRSVRAWRSASGSRSAATRSTRCSTRTRAGPRTTSTTGVGTSRGISNSSSRECFTEPHSTKQIEDAWAGGSRSARRRSRLGEYTKRAVRRRGARAGGPRGVSRCSSLSVIRGPRSRAWVPAWPSAKLSPTAGWSSSMALGTCRTHATRSWSTC